MLAIRDWELDMDRGEMEASLPDLAAVYRATETRGPEGEPILAYAVQTGLEAVPCRVLPRRDPRPQETQEGARIGAVTFWYILVPWDTDIIDTDRLLVNSVTYEVNDGGAPDRSQSLVLQLNCRVVE